jgi:hypothetical protein
MLPVHWILTWAVRIYVEKSNENFRFSNDIKLLFCKEYRIYLEQYYK